MIPPQRPERVRVAFVVIGEPVPKGRPRFAVTKRGAVCAYTPERTHTWETAVGWAARQAMAERQPFDGPVGVEIRFFSGRQGQERGDLDNLAKAILDGVNAIVFVDDAQVDALLAVRFYGDALPRAEVEVQVLGLK